MTSTKLTASDLRAAILAYATRALTSSLALVEKLNDVCSRVVASSVGYDVTQRRLAGVEQLGRASLLGYVTMPLVTVLRDERVKDLRLADSLMALLTQLVVASSQVSIILHYRAFTLFQ